MKTWLAALMLLLVAFPARADIVVDDDFDDGDADGWTEYNGVFSVSGGAYRLRSPSTGSDTRSVQGDPDWTNYRITCRFNLQKCKIAGVLFRVEAIESGAGAGRYYLFQIVDCARVEFCEVNYDGLSGSVLAWSDRPVPLNEWHRLRIDVLGNYATAWIDGEAVLSYDGFTSYPGGRIGLRAALGGIVLFDDVRVATEPFPFAVVDASDDGVFSLHWESAGPNVVYTVEQADPRLPGVWFPAPPAGQWPTSDLVWRTTVADARRLFYRVKAEVDGGVSRGAAVLFDDGSGGGGAMSFPTVQPALEAFSVEFWIRPLSHSDWNQNIAAAGAWGQFVFHTTDAGAIYAGTDLRTRFTPDEIPAGTLRLYEWQHFTYVYDGTVGRLYRNGELLGEKPQNPPAPWTGFRLGSTAGDTMHGSIDELRIYDRALTADEVSFHYNGGYGRYGTNEPGLLAGWHFDEGDGIHAWDYSGHWHLGTLGENASWGTGIVQPPPGS